MKVIRFFDKLEDRIRGRLSHYPILYAFTGGIGIVLFWRGVWHTTDWISLLVLGWRTGNPTIDFTTFSDGPISFILGSIMLLLTGLFVSDFIGNEIILSGLRGEKKLTEKTELEVRTETGAIAKIQEELVLVRKQLTFIEQHLKDKGIKQPPRPPKR